MAVNPLPGLVGLGDIQDEKLRAMLGQLERWAKGVVVKDVDMTYERQVGNLSLGDVATTYDDDPTSAQSAALRVNDWRTGTWEFTVTKTLAPTSILFTLQTSRNGGSTWYDSQDDDHTITVLAAAMPANVSMTTEFSSGHVRMSAVATGTDAANKITVTGGGKLGG